MKKLIISVLAVLILVAVMTVPAIADEQSKEASVTVTLNISFTVSDPGTAGINFGSVVAGTDNVSEAEQNGTGAVTLTIGAETNVDCDIQIKGSDNFTDGATHELLLSYAKWDTDNDVDLSTPMTSSYVTIDSSTAYVEKVVEVYHWLSIPSDQYAATYTTDFYYQAIESTP
jgi:hypothetical protein